MLSLKKFYLCLYQTSIVATGWGGERERGREVRTSLCGKCDVLFCYIYTNTVKLVLYFSYFVCLSCYSNALMSYCFKIAILAEICIKCVIFIEKLQKSRSTWDFAPRPPMDTGGWGICLQIPTNTSFPIENSWLHHFAKMFNNVQYLQLITTKGASGTRHSVRLHIHLDSDSITGAWLKCPLRSQLIWVRFLRRVRPKDLKKLIFFASLFVVQH